MARKDATTRNAQAEVQRSRAHLEAIDLLTDTRGMVQVLDDLFTRNRDTLHLEGSAIGGLARFFNIIDANVLGVQRIIDQLPVNIEATDLTNDVRGMVLFLEATLTASRNTLLLEANSIDGLSRFMQVIDDSLLAIIRVIDPEDGTHAAAA